MTSQITWMQRLPVAPDHIPAPAPPTHPDIAEALVSEQESLLLMYGWIVLAVLNLILITVAFLQYAD